MGQYVYPVLYALFIWWFSTGLILYLDGLPQRTFKWTLAGTTVVLAMALGGLAVSSNDSSVAGAYCGFTCAVLVWAWQEVAFLLGYVTGPRRTACPPFSVGWQRARHAFQAVAHHEAALVLLALAVLAATWGGSNQTGWWTFVILWLMRQSAKLNVFLGVRNLNEGFLPPHLAYLQTYFRRQRMNLLFPLSVSVSTGFAVVLWRSAMAQADTGHDATRLTFLAALMSLAILEHWFMVLPLPSEALWKWGLRSREASGATVGTKPTLP